MSTKFEIFKRLPGGKSCWITAPSSEEAEKRVDQLARITPGSYLIYSQTDGGIVERLPPRKFEAWLVTQCRHFRFVLGANRDYSRGDWKWPVKTQGFLASIRLA
jgi:hypothetical protein